MDQDRIEMAIIALCRLFKAIRNGETFDSAEAHVQYVEELGLVDEIVTEADDRIRREHDICDCESCVRREMRNAKK